MEALCAELNERVEAAAGSYSATGEFLQYINSVLMANNDQKIRLRCFVHEFSFVDSFLISFYMDVASYCYYAKVPRTMRTAILYYLFKYFY